jgi:hypothetical protein
MRRPWPVYPFLLAVYPVLFLYARNMQIVDFSETLAPAGIALGVLLLIWALAWIPKRDLAKSALVAALAVLLAQSFRPVQTVLPEKVAVVAWFAVLILGAVLLFKAPGPGPFVQRWLNVTAAFLIAFPLIAILKSETLYRFSSGDPPFRAPSSQAAKAHEASGPQVLPDIYDIVLDGYAREDVLRTHYGFDNRDLLSALRERKFFVADSARANYWQTTFSIGSMLNMSHIRCIKGTGEYFDCGSRRISMSDLVQKNTVSALLAGKGYRTVAFATGYTYVELRHADVFKDAQVKGLDRLSSFHYEALCLTPVPALNRLFNRLPMRSSETRRQRILNTLNHIADTSDRDSPLFVFAHVAAPHPPFVFHANGTPAAPRKPFSGADGSAYMQLGGTIEEYQAGYVDQLRFVNSALVRAVDSILERSTRPTVIVIHSDHGPGSLLDWDHPERSDFFERMSILLAVRLPDGSDPHLPADQTLVNLYPLLFWRLFHEEIPTSPDTYYYWSRFSRFVEIAPARLSR